MNPSANSTRTVTPTICRATLFVVLITSIAVAVDKPQPTYLKGTVMGWDIRVDTNYSGNGSMTNRRAKVYQLKGSDFVYKIDYCGAFQAGKFGIGQAVEYRVDGERLYIRHEDKEYKCKIEGTKAADDAKTSAPSTAP
jgi:hypothetical protein